MSDQIFNQQTETPSDLKTSSAIIPTSIIYAGFFRRFFANIIDHMISGTIGGIIGFILGGDIIISMSLSSIVGIIYFAIFESSELMGTPGKAMMGVALIDQNTLSKVSFKTGVLRFLLKFVSALFCMIGYLIQPYTSKRQAFHDIIAETLVIKKQAPEINYFKAFRENFSKLVNS